MKFNKYSKKITETGTLSLSNFETMTVSNISLLIGLSSLGLFEYVNADLPVHCLRNQVEGKWHFYLTEPSDTRTTCGHKTPDVDTAQPSDSGLNFVTQLTVSISDPNEATVTFPGTATKSTQLVHHHHHEEVQESESSDNNLSFLQSNTNSTYYHSHGTNRNHRKSRTESGNWTMIYDEGFNMETDTHSFFAFSKFKIPAVNMIHGKKSFESQCGKTEIGWYHDKKSNKFGCYKGEKVNEKDKETVFFHLSLLEEQQTGFQSHKGFLATKSQEKTSGVQNFVEQTHEQQLQFVDQMNHESIVDQINQDKSLTWKATSYSKEFLAEKMYQLRRRALNRAKVPMMSHSISTDRLNDNTNRDNVSSSSKSKSEPIQLGISVPHPGDSIEDKKATEKLPKNFNWSDVDGESYLDQMLDQADCGSCYAVSSVHMLSARYRVLKKDPKLLKDEEGFHGFSVNFPLYCSDLNQGCNGGYPSLISKWGSEVGMVPNKCGGSYFSSSSDTCASALPPNFKSCVEQAEKDNLLAKVASWNYIGGYYGACTSDKMLLDLYTYGPMAVALEPGPEFMFYRSGIYKSTPIKTDVNWVKVDHAVLLVGFGEEDADSEDNNSALIQQNQQFTKSLSQKAKKQKFWIIQNSWGSAWGENGNIRLPRGENESGVEFQAVSAQMKDGDAESVLKYYDSAVNMEL